MKEPSTAGEARREKLVKSGARIVCHGREVAFQLAGMAVPRGLFAGFLRRSVACGQCRRRSRHEHRKR